MGSDLRQFYDSVSINDKLWFICKYKDCDDCCDTEEDIILHIKHHIKEDMESEDNINANDEVITAQTITSEECEDIKPKIEIICEPTIHTFSASQESDDSYVNCLPPAEGFKCHINGCEKSFLYLKSLILHRKDHKSKAKIVAKPLIMKTLTQPYLKPQSKAQPKPMPKPMPTSNVDFNHIKEKYLRVQRLNDRSIHRWQKQDHRSDANYAGMQSLKNLNAYYRKDIIENEKYYLCQYNQNCLFKTKRSQHMARHLNCCHFRTRIFRCSVRGCDKKYYNPTSLRQHTLNHKCGFGILNGKTMVSLCGNKSINRFRRRIIENELKIYKCDFLDCPFKTKSHTCIKRHIHDQHLCPNRVKYFDDKLIKKLLSTDHQLQQNTGFVQNIELSQNIGIPEMIQMPDIRKTPKKKFQNKGNGWEIIPIPDHSVPQISGIPEMMEISVTPFRETPKIKIEIKEEKSDDTYGPSKSFRIVDEIDRLIDGHNYNNNSNQVNLRTNNEFNANEDSNESNDDIEIIEEIVVQQRTGVSAEFKKLLEDKNLTLDYSPKTMKKCQSEIEKLNRCRAHFDLKFIENVGLRYICKCCQFPAKSLESISMHLRLKHFIDN